MTAKDKITAEYDRCMRLMDHPWESKPLFGLPSDDESVRRYYQHRAEGLGYALDRLAEEEKQGELS